MSILLAPNQVWTYSHTKRSIRISKGIVRCANPSCVSVKAGYARRGRDGNAALNILLRGETEVSSANRQVLDVNNRHKRAKVPVPTHDEKL